MWLSWCSAILTHAVAKLARWQLHLFFCTQMATELLAMGADAVIMCEITFVPHQASSTQWAAFEAWE